MRLPTLGPAAWFPDVFALGAGRVSRPVQSIPFVLPGVQGDSGEISTGPMVRHFFLDHFGLDSHPADPHEMSRPASGSTGPSSFTSESERHKYAVLHDPEAQLILEVIASFAAMFTSSSSSLTPA